MTAMIILLVTSSIAKSRYDHEKKLWTRKVVKKRGPKNASTQRLKEHVSRQ